MNKINKTVFFYEDNCLSTEISEVMQVKLKIVEGKETRRKVYCIALI